MDCKEEGNETLIGLAAEWLVQLDAGTADPVAFEEWRDSDSRHAAAFAQVAALWKRTGKLRALEPADPFGAVEPTEKVPPRLTRRALLGGAVTGGALLAAGAVLFLGEERASAETRVGERRVIFLPDGSRAELNSNTRLTWRMETHREVWLERGEATLRVVENPERLFRLVAGKLSATLKRGRYNMRIREVGAELTALAGNAEVSLADRRSFQQLLPAGSTLVASTRGLAVEPTAPSLIRSIEAWPRGELVFDGMRLDQAVPEFNRYIERQIVIYDPRISSLRLGGRYFIDDPGGFLNGLEEGFGIRAVRSRDRTLLVGPDWKQMPQD